jgi:hypothetical protein
MAIKNLIKKLVTSIRSVIFLVFLAFASAVGLGCFTVTNTHAEITKTDWSIESDGDTTWYARMTIGGFSFLNPTSSTAVEIKKPLKNYIDSLLSKGKVEGTVKSDEPDEMQIKQMLHVTNLPLEAQAVIGAGGS